MVDIIIIIQDAGGLLIWPVCIVALILILLQGGAGDISSAFGGGGQLDSSLGVGAQQKISKVTGWFVAIFMVLVVVMSIPIKGELGAAETPAVETEDAGAAGEEGLPTLDDESDSSDADAGTGSDEQPADAGTGGDADAGADAGNDNEADGAADIQPVEEDAGDAADAGNADDEADSGADIQPIEE